MAHCKHVTKLFFFIANGSRKVGVHFSNIRRNSWSNQESLTEGEGLVQLTSL